MSDSTLVGEIHDDHKGILSRVREAHDAPRVDLNCVPGIAVSIGAHHLAEEETLYRALTQRASSYVGQAQMYHLMLDDLLDTMASVYRTEVSVRDGLLLLDDLLSHHFLLEEQRLLTTFENTFPYFTQVRLGRLYRRRYIENLEALCRAPF